MIKLVFGALAASLVLAASVPAAAQDNDRMAAMKAWKDCMTSVRKNYPVPPGTMNELNQRIKEQCGPRPS